MFKGCFKLLSFFLILFLFQISNAQHVDLSNSSFEDFPQPGKAPRGWYDCGTDEFPKETPPDVHPALNNRTLFGVDLPPIEGSTYLGMVVRENESYESIAQKLKSPLQVGKCYTFSIYLSRSELYLSAIRGRKGNLSFTEPITLRIWGGNNYCEKQQLLCESVAVENTIWEKYTFYFSPEKDFRFIKLEAYHNSYNNTFSNGNILLDKASSFEIFSCDDEKMKMKMVREKINFDEFKKKQQIKIEDYSKQKKAKKVIDEITRIKNEIEPSGRKVKFKKNILTPTGVSKLQRIVNEFEDISDFKLIINFNGLNKEKAKLRKENILKVFKDANFPTEDFEIQNTSEEDGRVIWFVEKKTFYLGVMDKKLAKKN